MDERQNGKDEIYPDEDIGPSDTIQGWIILFMIMLILGIAMYLLALDLPHVVDLG